MSKEKIAKSGLFGDTQFFTEVLNIIRRSRTTAYRAVNSRHKDYEEWKHSEEYKNDTFSKPG